MLMMSPSGMHWRYTIGPAIAFHSNHGALMSERALETLPIDADASPRDAVIAKWTSWSGSNGHHFGWTDAASDDARGLAFKFVERFPCLSTLGRGWDHAYAGWHLRLFGLAERGWLPTVMSDDSGPSVRGVNLLDVRPSTWRQRDDRLRPQLPLRRPEILPREHGCPTAKSEGIGNS